MKREYINELLKKYWAAETTLDEENIIRDHFRKNKDLDSAEGNLFQYFDQEAGRSYTKSISMDAPRKTFGLRIILSIAASFLIIAMAYIAFVPTQRSEVTPAVVVEDRDEAWKVTMEALSYLNGQVNKSQATIKENMQHFDKTLIFKS